MYDVHIRLVQFEQHHIRLSKAAHGELRTFRDDNIERLKAGLTRLGPMRGTRGTGIIDTYDQGGYAMHTLVQRERGDHDIDTAVIFRADALPASALDARKRVYEAIVQGSSGRFRRPPEVRTNAVTVWYAKGPHIDLAIYRERASRQGSKIIEHAGSSWSELDPRSLPAWFSREVARRSPSESAEETLPEGQLRRMVRYLKAFGISRSSWSLPGGLLRTALVVECYQPNAWREDIALYETMEAIERRLSQTTEIRNPMQLDVLLTTKQEHHAQLGRLRGRLREALDRMQTLHQVGCTEADAMGVWDWMFPHKSWRRDRRSARQILSQRLIPLRLEAGVARGNPSRIVFAYDRTKRLHPGEWICAHVKNFVVQLRHHVLWTVRQEFNPAEEPREIDRRWSRGIGNYWFRVPFGGDCFIDCWIYEGDALVAVAIPLRVKVSFDLATINR